MKLGKKEWARWAEWIERVKSDLQATVNDRAVFHGFGDVVRANEEWIRAHHGGYFCDFVARSYVARSAIGVRRHVKRDDDSVSLVQILSQMKDCAPQLTFDFYLQQFPRNDADGFFWQKPTFKLVSENGVVASGQIIASDIEKLKLLTVQVETFVDVGMGEGVVEAGGPVVGSGNEEDHAANPPVPRSRASPLELVSPRGRCARRRRHLERRGPA